MMFVPLLMMVGICRWLEVESQNETSSFDVIGISREASGVLAREELSKLIA